jgi:hypothetical protein
VGPIEAPVAPNSAAAGAARGNWLARWGYPLWMILICGFALLHTLQLGADFPNNTPWIFDFAKYTDEGWWGNAAVRAHLFGSWYLPGDFNPAAAVPVWPFLEWVVFCFTGVTIEAARGLAIAFFFTNLLLSYLFLRARGPRWMALLGVTLLVTSPFLYCFCRLAILEPLLTAVFLAALNLAVRLPRFRRSASVSTVIGLLFTLMMLTKTTAIFLLPAIGWAMIQPLWQQRRTALRCALAALGTAAVTFGLWMGLIVHLGLMRDYQYLLFVNKYEKPTEFYWPLLSLWWSLRGALWADHILVPLGGIVAVAALAGWRSCWSRALRNNPVFCSSVLAVAGYILFMTYQNHPQPRYYTVVAFFSFFVVVIGIEALLSVTPWRAALAWDRRGPRTVDPSGSARPAWKRYGAAWMGVSILVGALIAACLNGEWTLALAVHPEYTFVPAVQKLTRYIDQHPNGKRLLVSSSGDEISMVTHLPSIGDDFGTQELVSRLGVYDPGWFATWNVVDPGTLEDLHTRYSLEQVALFHAYDSPDRNMLVLFKLHPLPGGKVRDPYVQNLQVALPGDKIEVPIE